MKNKRKQRLIDLGAECLADALLELAIWSDAADDLVERMVYAPEENIQLETLQEPLNIIGADKKDEVILKEVATLISDWNNFNNHEEFKDHIYKTHSRKRSFWPKYKVEPSG